MHVLDASLKRIVLFIVKLYFNTFAAMSGNKRVNPESDGEEDWVGPLPSEAAPQKKQKG